MTHQERVVRDAMNSIELMKTTVGYTYSSIEEHMNYVYSIGFNQGRKHPSNGRPVAQIQDGRIINRFESVIDASHHMRGSKASIAKAASGVYRKALGFQWRYIDKELL